VRKDLPIADQLVQACHSAQDAGNLFSQPSNEPSHMAVLSVPNERSLLEAIDKIENSGVKMTVFFEPDSVDDGDIPMGYTAAASTPVTGEQRRVFRKYPLWKL